MTISAAENPELANAIVAQAMAATVDREQDKKPPEVPLPPDPEVALPGGVYDPIEGDVTTAEVRELTGEDEEVIARAGSNIVKIIDTILTRGVVKIGDETATRESLGTLLAGDRDYLLMQVRRATFGDEMEFTLPSCPFCKAEDIDITVSLQNDVPVSRLTDPSDAHFDLTLPSGKTAEVRLPNGDTQRALAEDNATVARMNTILLAHCVHALNGRPTGQGEGPVKALGLRDRDYLLEEINKRNCGPRLAEVKKACPQCEEEIPLPLSLAALFRL